jgi:hypothetical protein
MVRVLDWLSQDILEINFDASQLRPLVLGAMKNLNDQHYFDNYPNCLAAYAFLLGYANGQPQDLDAALLLANKDVVAAKGDPGHGSVSVAARTAQALAEAIKCYHPRNDNNIAAMIDAGDKAYAFALEAQYRLNDGTNGIDTDTCARKRQDLTSTISTWLNLGSAAVVQALSQYENNVKRPPWDHDTEIAPGFGGATISTPTTAPWYATTKGGSTWVAYGTDGGTAASRAATVQDTITGNTFTGSPISPTTGNDWGFSFLNLVSPDSVKLSVTVNYVDQTSSTPKDATTVG